MLLWIIYMASLQIDPYGFPKGRAILSKALSINAFLVLYIYYTDVVSSLVNRYVIV